MGQCQDEVYNLLRKAGKADDALGYMLSVPLGKPAGLVQKIGEAFQKHPQRGRKPIKSCYWVNGDGGTTWVSDPSDCGGGSPSPLCPDAPVSPLVLDLDGDGVESGGVAFFDHGNDGWAELTRWSGADDGVLVWDSNADGVINDGSELFGNNSVLGNGRKAAHGFAALADFDANGDGKVDSRDSGRDTNNDGVVDGKDKNWENLRVMRWTDANNNGIKESGEESMVTLASLNIRSLGTGFNTSAHVDTHGNEHRQVGSFTKTDGTTATMTDVWFVADQSVTTYSRSGIPTHSAVIAALPELTGGGRVYNLRDAMALDDATDANGNSRLTARAETRSLRELVAAFSSSAMAANKAGREALAEKILLRWAGAEGAVGRDY